MLKGSKLLMAVGGLLFAVMNVAACGSTGTSGDTSSDTSNTKACVPNATLSCACLGGKTGAQTCNANGTAYGTCQCGGAGGSGGGNGGSTATSTANSGSTGTAAPTCGNGVIDESDNCDTPTSEFYCASDCALKGTGGMGGGTTASSSVASSAMSSSSTGVVDPCNGHVHYVGRIDAQGSIWTFNGVAGFDGGNAHCKAAVPGSDHVCDYEEVKHDIANNLTAFSAIPQNATAWVQRTTPETVGGVVYEPGPGGRCNNWNYSTNHLSDGEYMTFGAAGTAPVFSLDNDTVFTSDPMGHTQAGLNCNGESRAILCCSDTCQ